MNSPSQVFDTFSNTGDMAEIISAMPSGTRICYHRGFLGADRTSNDKLSDLANFMLKNGCPEEYPLGEGVVIAGLNTGALTQRRIGAFDYEYFFTKRGLHA